MVKSNSLLIIFVTFAIIKISLSNLTSTHLNECDSLAKAYLDEWKGLEHSFRSLYAQDNGLFCWNGVCTEAKNASSTFKPVLELKMVRFLRTRECVKTDKSVRWSFTTSSHFGGNIELNHELWLGVLNEKGELTHAVAVADYPDKWDTHVKNATDIRDRLLKEAIAKNK